MTRRLLLALGAMCFVAMVLAIVAFEDWLLAAYSGVLGLVLMRYGLTKPTETQGAP